MPCDTLPSESRFMDSVPAGMHGQSRAYPGCELKLFAHAINWKRYWAKKLWPYLGKSVLEVGAGLGGNTAMLCANRAFDSWLCLEPDSNFAQLLQDLIGTGGLPSNCSVICGTIHELEVAHQFDTILYIDVLEHIADDKAEVARAAELLSIGGCLWVLAPAHQWLFSAFDAAIGHHRRYNKDSLTRLTPASLSLERIEYLDTVGMIASAANRGLLRQDIPSFAQIKFWDSVMVPMSRLVDPVTRFRLGKSIIAIWRRT